MSRFSLSCLSVAALAACGSVGSEFDHKAAALSGGCPDGWYDAAVVRLACVDGTLYTTHNFYGTLCASCQSATPARCNGQWQNLQAEVACAPGYEFAYNHEGTCKRCRRAATTTERAPTACVTDADCVLGGCSGELCVSANSEPVYSICMWREEYACYREPTTSCGCNNGSCGWAQTAELRTCLQSAGTVTAL